MLHAEREGWVALRDSPGHDTGCPVLATCRCRCWYGCCCCAGLQLLTSLLVRALAACVRRGGGC